MNNTIATILIYLMILPSSKGADLVLGKEDDGIYCLFPGELPGKSVNLQSPSNFPPWHANYISGMALRSVWAVIQPYKGVYDWSFFDQGLGLARQYNKKISLSVAAGGFSPNWLINEGASYLNITIQTNFLPQPEQLQMVLPWDPTFQREWSTFIHAMAARYDGSSNVSYVYVGGPGNYIETYVVRTQQDYDAFNAVGGLPKWIESAKAVIDMYGSSFKQTPFLMAVANPVGQIPSAQAAGESAVEEVVNYGLAKYPGRFGVACDSLNDNSATTGSTYFANQMIEQNSAMSPAGFQMLAAATNSPSTSTVTDLYTALAAGIELGGQFVEVYQTDCMNPQYTRMLSQANAYLKAN
jgi:hypothetical protein